MLGTTQGSGLLLLLLLLGAVVVVVSLGNVRGCYNIENNNNNNNGEDGSTTTNNNLLTIGLPSPICLIINDRSFIAIEPIVDQYSRFNLTGSYKAASNLAACDPFWFPLGCKKPKGVQQTFYLEVNGVKSQFKKLYSDPAHKFYYPIMTAVISVANGNVTSVAWDDGCYFCPSGQNQPIPGSTQQLDELCLENAYTILNNTRLSRRFFDSVYGSNSTDMGKDCGLTTNYCNTTPGISCDLGIYIVWTGTDSFGRKMSSASLRWSRFVQYKLPSLTGTLQSALGGGERVPTTLAPTPVAGR